jgi:hypothetical protein
MQRVAHGLTQRILTDSAFRQGLRREIDQHTGQATAAGRCTFQRFEIEFAVGLERQAGPTGTEIADALKEIARHFNRPIGSQRGPDRIFYVLSTKRALVGALRKAFPAAPHRQGSMRSVAHGLTLWVRNGILSADNVNMATKILLLLLKLPCLGDKGNFLSRESGLCDM